MQITETNKANVKLIFNFNIIGNVIKNINEGMTIIIVLKERSIIFWIFFVSQYIHINAKIEVKGNEMSRAANNEDFLAISVTVIITTNVNNVFINK